MPVHGTACTSGVSPRAIDQDSASPCSWVRQAHTSRVLHPTGAPSASGNPGLGTSWARECICISAFDSSWSRLLNPFYFWHLHPLGNEHQFHHTPCITLLGVLKLLVPIWCHLFVISTGEPLLSAFSPDFISSLSYPLLIIFFPTWKCLYSFCFLRKPSLLWLHLIPFCTSLRSAGQWWVLAVKALHTYTAAWWHLLLVPHLLPASS